MSLRICFELSQSDATDFIRDRMCQLETMIGMLVDKQLHSRMRRRRKGYDEENKTKSPFSLFG